MTDYLKDTLSDSDGVLLEDHTPVGGPNAFTWINLFGPVDGGLEFKGGKLYSHDGFQGVHYSSVDVDGDQTIGVILCLDDFTNTNRDGMLELFLNFNPSDQSSYRFKVQCTGSSIEWTLYNWDSASEDRAMALPVTAFRREMLVQLRLVGNVIYGMINGAIVGVIQAPSGERPVGRRVGFHASELVYPFFVGPSYGGESYIRGPVIVDQPEDGGEQYPVPVYGDNFTEDSASKELSTHTPTVGGSGSGTHEELDSFTWQKGLKFLDDSGFTRADLTVQQSQYFYGGTFGLRGGSGTPRGSHYQAVGTGHSDDQSVMATTQLPDSPVAGDIWGVSARVPQASTGDEDLNGWTLTLDVSGNVVLTHWVAGVAVDTVTVTLVDLTDTITFADFEMFSTVFDIKMPHTLSLRLIGTAVSVYLDGVELPDLALTGATETGGLPGYLGILKETGTSDRVYSSVFLVEDIALGLFIAPLPAEMADDSPKPYELYRFVQGADSWNYTTREGPVVMDGITYEPIEIQRTSFALGSDRGDAGIEVTLPRNSALLVTMFDGTTPGSISLFIYVPSRDDPTVPVPIFIGKVGGLSSTKSIGKLVVNRIQDEDEEQIPRKAIQLTCANMLYDSSCRADIASFTFPLTIATIDGRTYTFTGTDHIEAGSSYYQNGFIQLGPYRAFVEFQDGDTIRTLSPLPTAIVGSVISAIAGCDRTTAVCKSRFDNVENFLGFPFIPGRNPWIVGLS